LPVISSFYGISIKMYFQHSEHNPPHFHVIYKNAEAEVDIRTGMILAGSLPRKAEQLVREWANLHRAELLQIWETQVFIPLPPLERRR